MAKKKLKTFESAFNTYQFIKQIGEGGSGIVIKVKDKDSKYYALKYLKSNVISEIKRKRFKNEMFFCIRNQHQNIIKILDYGYYESASVKCPFYLMHFYPVTLRKLMDQGIEYSRVLPLFSKILNGIEAAHFKNVWHRDIKPENILLSDDDQEIVFADFGIAHFEEDALHTCVETKPHERLANFQYAAPEQIQRRQSVDQRTDIYALGMILNEMFTKNIPIGTNYKKIGTTFPDYSYIDSLVERMISNSPEDRPNSISDIKKELIARGNQFVVEQKLNKLKDTVIPETEIDDPLIIEPPQITGVDYENGTLVLKLDKRLNDIWIDEFYRPRSGSYPMGLGPQDFHFSGDGVRVNINVDKTQQAVDKFKEYLDRTTQSYKIQVHHDIEAKKKRKETELQRQIKNEEQRQRVLKNIKI